MWNKLHASGYTGYSFNVELSNVTELLPDKYLTNNMRILEIGSGRGDYMRLFSPLVGEVHGVDISRDAVKLAWIHLWWYENTYPTVCDGLSLPYKDNYFDFIYEISVFQHIPRSFTLNYLIETNRCLKPSGLFAAQFISRYGEKENYGDIVFPEKEETIGYMLDDIIKTVDNSGLKFLTYKKHIFPTRNNVLWYKILCRKGDSP